MEDYNSNVKDCPFYVNIMGISPTGIHFIGRRYESNMKRDSANGLSINVSRLDPITGHIIGTINTVKWKPFNGSFEKNFNSNTPVVSGRPPRPSLNAKQKYGFADPIMTNKAMKKYKISSGVAYRWMHNGELEYRIVGKNRYVPRAKFVELAENHHGRHLNKRKKNKVVAARVITYPPVTTQKRWWQFWK
jgi:hypothetical protein